MSKQTALAFIQSHASYFTELSDRIWDVPELSLQEYRSMDTYCKALVELGFTVQTGLAGVKTAFSGTYGSGRPVIGILGEFDALSGLSQQAGATEPRPVCKGAPGHGCGHNLLGAGALAAAAAVKAYLEQQGEGSGTVIFFGCPGEEGGAGKAFMARENLFSQLDAALTWHPEDVNEVSSGSCLASYQVEYQFTGIAAHAAGCPHLGRSALDAVELMNVAAQFLREHIPPHDGLHYAITNAGGLSPNVVQPTAQVLYMLRSDSVPHILKLAERVDDMAKGAALMTGTTMKRKFIDGSADVLPNSVLEKLLYQNLTQIPLHVYTQEEQDFARALRETYVSEGLPGFASGFDEEVADYTRQASDNGRKALNDFVVPLRHLRLIRPGSTDVGDVSRQTPTVQLHAATCPAGTPGHSWQEVAVGKSSIAHKGMLFAAQVLASTAIDLYQQPSVLAAAREEYMRKGSGSYVCPIPADAQPVIAGEDM